MNKIPFLYFSDAVVAKLYPQWAHTGVTLEQFTKDCRDSKWDLYQTCLSYNAPIPNVESCSFFGEKIDPNKEYMYENFSLIGPTLDRHYTRIGCTIYYHADKEPYMGQPEDNSVAVCFYDC